MSRPLWSLHAYRLIEPDEQLDLFACREVRVHLLARQLRLADSADRTLCGGLLPAAPRCLEVTPALLHDRRLCTACLRVLMAERRGEFSHWADV
jgi:hypothetical protein